MFNFICLSMLSTLVGLIGLIIVLSCVILIFDLLTFIMDKITDKQYNTVFDKDINKQNYQGNEDTNE